MIIPDRVIKETGDTNGIRFLSIDISKGNSNTLKSTATESFFSKISCTFVLADIAKADGNKSGSHNEAIFFGANSFVVNPVTGP